MLQGEQVVTALIKHYGPLGIIIAALVISMWFILKQMYAEKEKLIEKILNEKKESDAYNRELIDNIIAHSKEREQILHNIIDREFEFMKKENRVQMGSLQDISKKIDDYHRRIHELELMRRQ